MSQETNPYQPPQGHDETSALALWKRRLWNVWVFAMIWPFIAIFFRRLTLPLIMMSGDWSVFSVISMSLFLFGWAICIIAAVRYPASIKTRVLRGIGSLLLLFAFGQVARSVFALIYFSLH